MRALVNLAISLRSGKISSAPAEQGDPEEFTYLGNREAVFEALKGLMPETSPGLESGLKVPDQRLGSLLLFDSASLSFSEIFNGIRATAHGVRKRVISGTGEFFVGSDDPGRPGDCRSIS